MTRVTGMAGMTRTRGTYSCLKAKMTEVTRIFFQWVLVSKICVTDIKTLTI